MSIEQNKAIARRFFEIWNAGTPEELDSCLAANYVIHNPLPGVSQDLKGIKQWQMMVSAAFPDIHFSVEQQVAEGDLVSTRWKATGTHSGEFMGVPAQHKSIEVTGMTHNRIADGKSVESWGEWDTMGMMQQLGAVPTAA